MFDVMYARYILTIAAFVIITMMDVLYFSKYRSTNKLKHKMYSYLTIFNTILLISELCIMVVFWNDLSFDTCSIFLKLRDIWLMFYFTMLLFYYYTSVNNLQYDSLFEFLKNEKIMYPHILFTVGVIAIHFFLPYNYMTKYTFNYTFSGTAFYVTIIYCVLTTLETISLVIFKNKGGISFSEKLSLVWLFSLMVVILVLQTIFSGANIMGLISSLYILGLYFIFENPDLELVEEIDALTEEVEKANRTKLDFLSNVSTEMVDPINNIVELSEGILNTKEFDGKKLFDDIKQMELSSKSFLEIVNNTLDTPVLDEYLVYDDVKETIDTNVANNVALQEIVNIIKGEPLPLDTEITNTDDNVEDNNSVVTDTDATVDTNTSETNEEE